MDVGEDFAEWGIFPDFTRAAPAKAFGTENSAQREILPIAIPLKSADSWNVEQQGGNCAGTAVADACDTSLWWRNV